MYQTLLSLFNEEVHLVALANVKQTSTNNGGFLRRSTTTTSEAPNPLRDLEDLKSKKVGAAGGGFITASVLQFQSNVGFEVVKFNDGKEVLAALERGDIDVALFVGGAPLPNLSALDSRYRLLTISDRLQAKLEQAGVYHRATMTYTKISPEAVSTVAVPALMIGRVYRTPKFVAALKSFREAFFSRLIELQETPNVHPKWQEMPATQKDDASLRGPWQWMELN